RICFIDTENRRSCYYASKFDFDILELDEYSPEAYVDAIDDALEEGYKIIVVDTVSLEWSFLLDIHSKMPGNSFANFAKITPRHDKFLDKILQSDAHFIVCCRSKEKYVLEEQNGKQVPVKKGVELVMREGMEYIMTASFNVDMTTHTYSSMKDNTDLFTYDGNLMTEKDGVNLIKWANNGNIDDKYAKLEKAKEEGKAIMAQNEEKEAEKLEKEVAKKKASQKKDNSLDGLKSQILELCKTLSEDGKREGVTALMKNLVGSPNPNNIKDVEKAEEVLEALSSLV
ncbi:MAG: AAA family ATPase, partial [Peptostreptococcaceae bacterium]